ncbi:MAG: Malonyl CoA-acyl carrier protein transacylase [Elusimicrobia bacterium ADurb.Bin231]|nr:MAG: Malonyl CoA-acyl carrier protein transacylase [Elusimicrobia bacterium ADurb.Bin231]
MKKIMFVFPGQASQYVGMGKEFFDNHSIFSDIINRANDDAVGYDIKKIIFEGPLDQLSLTKHTQPAVFIISVACFCLFESKFPMTDVQCLCAGHSLGEYSALVACGALTFEDALALILKRAEYLQEASDKSKGGMAAILGATESIVCDICKEASSCGICQAVNFNAPGQIIISGELAALETARRLAKEKKVKMIPLAVSGAFHSSLMKDAAAKMAIEMKKYQFDKPKFPIITNCDAEINTEAYDIPAKLVKQIASPVLWIDTIQKAVSAGYGTFIEFGPKNIVSGMIRKIHPEANIFNVENEITLKNTLEGLSKI